MEIALDRITLGEIKNNETLERLGEVCFKLYSNFDEITYAGKHLYNHKILAKLSNGDKIFDQSISSTFKKKDITKQKFLEEVNEDLSQIRGYLAGAEYSNPFFGRKNIRGILYKEKIDKPKNL